MFKLSLLLLVLFQLIAVLVFAQEITLDSCRPDDGTPEGRCRELIAVCAAKYCIRLKWTGTGTVINGNRLQDGGCQCSKYCGYFSKGPCGRDKQCYWNRYQGRCFSKSPNAPGYPMKECKPFKKPIRGIRRGLVEDDNDEVALNDDDEDAFEIDEEEVSRLEAEAQAIEERKLAESTTDDSQ